MASAIFNPPYLSHPSSSSISPKIVRKPSQISCSKTLTIRSLTRVPNLSFIPFSNWNGLRKNDLSISLHSLKLEKRKKCKGKGVFASLFGVGAPEALVIGVVALLVFGPKGLAEVAKNLGKTLRAFQPTIRELQEVSREFKSTLEKEIGLDDLQNPVQGNYTSNTVRPPSPPSSQVPPDTLQNSQLTSTPPAITTEDSQETTTAPATTTEDSLATTTSLADTTEDTQATTTSPGDTTDDSQATSAIPAVTMEDSQPAVDTPNGSPSVKAYSSEDLLKITEEQLKAVASQQQKEQPPSSTPLEDPQSEV